GLIDVEHAIADPDPEGRKDLGAVHLVVGIELQGLSYRLTNPVTSLDVLSPWPAFADGPLCRPKVLNRDAVHGVRPLPFDRAAHTVTVAEAGAGLEVHGDYAVPVRLVRGRR